MKSGGNAVGAAARRKDGAANWTARRGTWLPSPVTPPAQEKEGYATGTLPKDRVRAGEPGGEHGSCRAVPASKAGGGSHTDEGANEAHGKGCRELSDRRRMTHASPKH